MDKVELNPDRELNLKGTICPYNFIKAKIALEEMAVGQILRVVVDAHSAVTDVPQGLEFEGQEILRIYQINEKDWEIYVKRVK